MKKIKNIFLFAFCLLCGAFLFACGDENKPTYYTISITPNEYVEIDVDKESATEGETITITITKNNENVEISGVYANQTNCILNNGDYIFTMPAENVTINVDAKMVYTEVMFDNFLSWNTLTPSQIIPQETKPLNGWGAYLSFDIIGNLIYVTNDNAVVELYSTNETVIPSDSLEISFNSANMGNGMDGGDIYIDTSKVNFGTTYIVLTLKDPQVSSRDTSTIVKKIDVVTQEGFNLDGLYMTETITLDISDIKNSSSYFAIQLFDNDDARYDGLNYSRLNYEISGIDATFVLTGSNANFRFEASQIESDEIAITFSYLKNHTYGLAVLGFETDNYVIAESIRYQVSNKIVSGVCEYTTTNGLKFYIEDADISLSVSEN